MILIFLIQLLIVVLIIVLQMQKELYTYILHYISRRCKPAPASRVSRASRAGKASAMAHGQHDQKDQQGKQSQQGVQPHSAAVWRKPHADPDSLQPQAATRSSIQEPSSTNPRNLLHTPDRLQQPGSSSLQWPAASSSSHPYLLPATPDRLQQPPKALTDPEQASLPAMHNAATRYSPARPLWLIKAVYSTRKMRHNWYISFFKARAAHSSTPKTPRLPFTYSTPEQSSRAGPSGIFRILRLNVFAARDEELKYAARRIPRDDRICIFVNFLSYEVYKSSRVVSPSGGEQSAM
ncbi:3'-5' ssDNA/RNA exonuclease TatD, partial [Frankliniella fusca]